MGGGLGAADISTGDGPGPGTRGASPGEGEGRRGGSADPLSAQGGGAAPAEHHHVGVPSCKCVCRGGLGVCVNGGGFGGVHVRH